MLYSLIIISRISMLPIVESGVMILLSVLDIVVMVSNPKNQISIEYQDVGYLGVISLDTVHLMVLFHWNMWILEYQVHS